MRKINPFPWLPLWPAVERGDPVNELIRIVAAVLVFIAIFAALRLLLSR
jgi:hypothetical protein